MSLDEKLQSIQSSIFRIALLGYLFVDYTTIIGTYPVQRTSVAIFGAMVLLTSFLMIGRWRALSLPLLLVGAGLLINIVAGASVASYAAALHELSHVAVLLVILPIVSNIFAARPYGEALFRLTGYVGRIPAIFQAGVSLLTHVIAAIASVTTIFITMEVLRQAVGHNQARMQRGSVAILRGYATAQLWAPSTAPFIVALHYTQAPFLRATTAAFMLAVAVFLFQVAVEWLEERAAKLPPLAQPAAAQDAAAIDLQQLRADRKLIKEFFFILALFLAALVAFEQVLSLDIIHLVPLVGLLLVAAVFGIRQGAGGVKRVFTQYFHEGLPSRHKEMALVQSAGFFVGSLQLSGFGDQAIQYLIATMPTFGQALVPWFGLLIPLLAIVGMPPMPSTLLVLASIDPAIFAQSPIFYCLSIIMGTQIATLIAPFSIPIMVLSQANHTNVWQISLFSNWHFVIGLFFFGQLVLWLLHTYSGLF